jgi:F-type H+-transporting ATPase subunit gamma
LATAREIKRRIKSIRNTAQVTRAMETIAASRMRRAQQQVLSSRPYSKKAWEVLTYLARLPQSGEAVHPLLQQRPEKSIGLVLITADRGLAGGLNSNMIRKAVSFLKEKDLPTQIIAVGKKGRDWMVRYGPPLRASFVNLGDRPTAVDIAPIARIVIEDYINRAYDGVYVGYTDFINTLRQEPTIFKLLPIEPAEPTVPMAPDYIFEPDINTVLDTVLRQFTEIQILQAVYEAIASEQSARMVAMRNATEAAEDLIADLTLSYNKARQQSITRELLDITGASEAMKKSG